MENTNPFSFYFAAGKERQQAGSSGEQCPDFNCCRGVREGREPSPPRRSHRQGCSIQAKDTPRASASPGFLCGKVHTERFHTTGEDWGASHPTRPHLQSCIPTQGSHFPRNLALATDVPSGCADRHLFPNPGLGFKIFVERRKEVGERRSSS